MILDMLRHTPFWVWAVLAKLVVLGLWQTRARRIGRGRVTLLPLVMIGLSFGGVLSSFGFGGFSGLFLVRSLSLRTLATPAPPRQTASACLAQR